MVQEEGYSRQLLNHYVSTGWLEQPARGLFRRPRGTLSWQQVVISLQTILLDDPFIVGGRTALELQGYAHFLPQKTREVHLLETSEAAKAQRHATGDFTIAALMSGGPSAPRQRTADEILQLRKQLRETFGLDDADRNEKTK